MKHPKDLWMKRVHNGTLTENSWQSLSSSSKKGVTGSKWLWVEPQPLRKNPLGTVMQKQAVQKQPKHWVWDDDSAEKEDYVITSNCHDKCPPQVYVGGVRGEHNWSEIQDVRSSV